LNGRGEVGQASGQVGFESQDSPKFLQTRINTTGLTRTYFVSQKAPFLRPERPEIRFGFEPQNAPISLK